MFQKKNIQEMIISTVDTKKQHDTKYGCTCTCCKQRNLPQYMCVIFVKKNYNFTNKYICDKLLNRYREVAIRNTFAKDVIII